MAQIFLKLIKKIHGFLLWAWKQDGTPAQRARGIAVGVFSGCFPLFGLQTFIGIFLARIFKANHLLAAVGTWISNPFTYLPLYWFNYKIGTVALGVNPKLSEFNQLTRYTLLNQGLFLGRKIFVGSTLVGLCFGSLAGLTLYFILQNNDRYK